MIGFLYWINPWLTLSVPLALSVIFALAEYESRMKRIEELEMKLKEAKEREEFLKEKLSDVKTCNKGLRHQLQERENELKELSRDHETEIKKIELKAE